MPESPAKPRTARTLSLAFWLALLLAAGLYGAVALSPKVMTYWEQRRTYVTNQVELVKLESRVNYLKRVADVMEHDPQFAAELARTEFDIAHSGDERIPVAHELTLAAAQSPVLEAPNLDPPVYEPAVRFLAKNEAARRWVLMTAGAIVLIAFTFLHASQAPKVPRAAAGGGEANGGIRRRFGRIFSRYRKKSAYDSNSPDGVG